LPYFEKDSAVDWETPYTVSRSLFLEIARDGKFLASSSMSRRPQVLGEEALPVLQAFAAGDTPRAAFTRLAKEWEVEEDGFSTVVDGLVAQNFLTPLAEISPQLASEGFASAAVHHYMLRDAVRVFAYRSAIFRQCPGKRVAEIGCGTGILSIFAAQSGARQVVAIEESRIADVAAKMLAANGVDGTVELRLGNSRDVELGEPADVVIHEILGNDPFGESILSTLADARRFLAPGGRFLPYRLEVACRGIDLGEDPRLARERSVAETRELAGLYGIDFGPFLEALAAVPPGVSGAWTGENGRFKPAILTDELVLCDLDFQHGEMTAPFLEPRPTLAVHTAGKLSGVVIYFRAHLDEAVSLTNSPLAPSTHWGWDVRPFSRTLSAAPGDRVALEAELRQWLGRQSLRVDLAMTGPPTAEG
jgi:2-polyprenyl-3-methyl-5-hydroxy-6-metoxy-1,4-benzoquinol methylase